MRTLGLGGQRGMQLMVRKMGVSEGCKQSSAIICFMSWEVYRMDNRLKEIKGR